MWPAPLFRAFENTRVAHPVWLWYIRQSKEAAQPVRVIPHNDIAKGNEKLEELLRKPVASSQ